MNPKPYLASFYLSVGRRIGRLVAIPLGMALALNWGLPDPSLATDIGDKPLESHYESYFLRPDIFSVKPAAHPGLGSQWENVKKGQFETIAMLLEMYPQQELYFLARDSELLYDLARWVTKDDPRLASRIHLINISRDNMASKHLKDYLRQEGIHEQALLSGKKFLFIDTGYLGSVPSEIAAQFPKNFRSQLSSRFLHSQNPNIPSSRVFLSQITGVPWADPTIERDKKALDYYEDLPHYTARSSEYVKSRGVWHPISVPGSQPDGVTAPSRSTTYREDIIYAAQQEGIHQKFVERRLQWRKLSQLSATQDTDRVIAELIRLLETHPNDLTIEAMVRDFIEMIEMGQLPDQKDGFKITLRDVGLTATDHLRTGNLAYLAKKYPDWAPILNHPKKGIRNLIYQNHYSLLGTLADRVRDDRFLRILGEEIRKAPYDEHLLKFIADREKRGRPELLKYLSGIKEPSSIRVKTEILIRKCSDWYLQILHRPLQFQRN